MFERFTDRARRSIVLAQEESRQLNHDYIGTEHILLGLLLEGEGVAAKALNALGFTHQSGRDLVEAVVGCGSGTREGHIPFTPEAKKALEMALREALQLGHNYIGTEHVLLGLVREGERLAKLQIDPVAVRRQVVQMLTRQVAQSSQIQVQMDADDLVALVCDVLSDRQVQVVIATRILARLRDQGATTKAG